MTTMMNAPIPDPEDANRAIMPSGKLGYAVRFLPQLDDPTNPTQAEFDAGTIVGYHVPSRGPRFIGDGQGPTR